MTAHVGPQGLRRYAVDLGRGVAAALWQEREFPGSTLLSLPVRPVWRMVAQIAAVGGALGVGLALYLHLTSVGLDSRDIAILVSMLTAAPLVSLPAGTLLCWRLATVAATLVWFYAGELDSWPALFIVIYCAVLVLVGLRNVPATAVGVGVLTTGVCLVCGLLATSSLAMGLISAIACVVPLAAGQAVYALRRARRELAAEQQGREQDATGRAVLRERARISRELHDVVAHHLSMIAIQASAAQLRDTELTEQSRETFALIEQTARASLVDMRRVIGVLREDLEKPERAPQAGMDGIADLVTAAQRAGQQVSVEWRGDRAVPAPVGISAYRLVQEALSNARRHAPGSAVRICVTVGADTLALAVVNDATPASHWPEGAASGPVGGGASA